MPNTRLPVTPRTAWFLAFSAVFASLAAYVFWGAWSPGVTPVMPDCLTVHPVGYFAALSQYFSDACLKNWQFIPDDLLLFFGTPYFRQELQFAFAAYFAALGLVYYCRGRGLCRQASYSAAILLAFSGYWFSLYSAGHLGWFRLMTYCVFAFGLADRAVRKGKAKNALLLGAVLAWGCRHQQDLWMIFAIFAGAYFLWCCVRERKLPWKTLALAALAFAAIGAANVRTAFTDALASREKQLEESKGTGLSGGEGKSDEEAKWIFVTNWSMPPEDTLEFFIPRIHGDTSCPLTLSIGTRRKSGVTPYTGRLGRPIDAPSGNYRQHSLYVGFVTCALALAALVMFFLSVAAKKKCGDFADGKDFSRVYADLPFFACAALVFWLLSLGRFCEPVYRIVFHVPFLDSLRAPVKWHHATEFAIVVLAAYGIDLLLARFAARMRFARSALLAVVLVGACDLARVNHLYLAPVDLTEVKRRNSEMQLTILPRQQFSTPQGAAMLRSKTLIPLATFPGRDDMIVAEYLTPRKPPAPVPTPPAPVCALGILSLLGTIAVGAYAIKKA